MNTARKILSNPIMAAALPNMVALCSSSDCTFERLDSFILQEHYTLCTPVSKRENLIGATAEDRQMAISLHTHTPPTQGASLAHPTMWLRQTASVGAFISRSEDEYRQDGCATKQSSII